MTVATFKEPWNAHILRGQLEAEGVLALVIHENHIGQLWPWAMALGGVKVQVLPDEMQNARAVEQLCLAGDYQKELEQIFGPIENPVCPSCRSSRFTSRNSWSSIGMLVISYLVFGVIFPLHRSTHQCEECSTKWND
jgi:hypothetical protein